MTDHVKHLLDCLRIQIQNYQRAFASHSMKFNFSEKRKKSLLAGVTTWMDERT